MERFYKGDFADALLDSRLITGVEKEKYNIKLIDCGEYVQLYYYPEDKYKKTKEVFNDLDLYKPKKNFIEKVKFDNIDSIEYRNILRSKLNCQRIAKCNSKYWKSFITLTYADNMQDIKQGKLDLNYWLKNVKKVKRDFKYIAIPEFQKRGAVHFHILTNLSLQDNNIIIPQEDKRFYKVKYWSKGFSNVQFFNNDMKKVVGYISKYMTEDCDNRLFAIRRFTTSQNLDKPVEEFLDIHYRYTKEKRYYNKVLKDCNLIYENTYKDKFDNDVIFMEFLKVNIRKD